MHLDNTTLFFFSTENVEECSSKKKVPLNQIVSALHAEFDYHPSFSDVTLRYCRLFVPPPLARCNVGIQFSVCLSFCPFTFASTLALMSIQSCPKVRITTTVLSIF